MDKILIEIVGENWLTLYITITLLKGIALITPSVTDNKIVTLLSNTYDTLRSGRAPEQMRDTADDPQ